jgi:hypothetical protein
MVTRQACSTSLSTQGNITRVTGSFSAAHHARTWQGLALRPKRLSVMSVCRKLRVRDVSALLRLTVDTLDPLHCVTCRCTVAMLLWRRGLSRRSMRRAFPSKRSPRRWHRWVHRQSWQLSVQVASHKVLDHTTVVGWVTHSTPSVP